MSTEAILAVLQLGGQIALRLIERRAGKSVDQLTSGEILTLVREIEILDPEVLLAQGAARALGREDDDDSA